jgi:hypothetical protein
MAGYRFLPMLDSFLGGMLSWFTISFYYWKPNSATMSNLDSKTVAFNPIRVEDIPFPARRIWRLF